MYTKLYTHTIRNEHFNQSKLWGLFVTVIKFIICNRMSKNFKIQQGIEKKCLFLFAFSLVWDTLYVYL